MGAGGDGVRRCDRDADEPERGRLGVECDVQELARQNSDAGHALAPDCLRAGDNAAVDSVGLHTKPHAGKTCDLQLDART